MTKWIKKLAASAAIAGALASGAVNGLGHRPAPTSTPIARSWSVNGMDSQPDVQQHQRPLPHSGVSIGAVRQCSAYGVRDYCPSIATSPRRGWRGL